MAKQLPIETPAYVARRMWNYLAAHKGRALYTFVIYMVSTLMGAVVPLQIGATVDDVAAGKFSSYPWQRIQPGHPRRHPRPGRTHRGRSRQRRPAHPRDRRPLLGGEIRQ